MRHFLTVLLMVFIALPAALAQPTEAAKQAAGKAVTTEAPGCRGDDDDLFSRSGPAAKDDGLAATQLPRPCRSG